MSTEVGRLHAIFDLDAKPFDRGLRGVETRVAAVTGVMKSLGSASVALQGPLGGIAGRLQGLSSLSSQLGKELGLLGVGMGIVSAVGIGLGVTMFKLAKYAADAGDEIFDLTQKVNFSAESISALKNAGETAGVEFGSLSSALGIFNKNVELVNQGDEKLTRTFRALKIDVRDNEAALRSAFKALLNVKDGSQQGALAMQIFGRSGKEVLGIIKATNGDLDAAIKRYQELGTLIGTDAAESANKFSDQLKELEQKLQGVARTMGQQFMPIVVDALDKINAALDSNRGHAKSWADDMVSIFSFAAAQIGHVLEGLSLVIEGFRKTFGEGSIVGDAIKGETMPRMLSLGGNRVMNLKTREVFTIDDKGNVVGGSGFRELGINVRGEDAGEFAIAGGAGQFSTGAGGGLIKKGGRINLGGGGGKGGGEDPAKTAQRIAALQLEAVVAGLQAEQDANRRALDLRRHDFNTYATQYMVIENRRHDAVIAGLDAERRAAERLKKGKDVALLEIANKRTAENTTHEQNRNRVLDERAHILDQIDDFIKQQERSIADARGQTDEWDRAYRDLVETLRQEGVVLESNTDKRIKAILQIEREIAKTKELTRERIHGDRPRRVSNNIPGELMDIGGIGNWLPGTFFQEGGTGTSRERVATVELQVMRERLAMIREQMHALSGELTNIFSQSISDGFNNGIKSGLQTLTQGLLRIVEDVFLRRLADGLGNLLTGLASGGGGGGFWSKLLGITVGGLTGGFAGGPSGAATGGIGSRFAGAFATGGNIPMGQWGVVHDNERVYVTPAGAQVIPAIGGKGGPQMVTNNQYIINLPPDSRGNYSSPRSKRQLSDKLIAALQASQA